VNLPRIQTTAEISAAVDGLVDQWCDRRALRALGLVLQAWPSTLALTDDLGELRTALLNVLAFARSELAPGEIDALEEVVVALDGAVRRLGRSWT
jgi:hypothetical protein